ncbi:synaptogyrin-3 [Protopterus annectens]|uniref:synaptogyrin-3 n=1 Tax=Protopterus annectens TaxID=7888 RepID=UPI001CF9911A|nr:synaptogyrin-3 [Protopterus annectens]
MMEGTSFGAGRAGGAFEPIPFLRKPQTILRIICWIFSIVVFGSILNEGYINSSSSALYCIFNKNANACNYGITIGFMAFFASTFFFILDVYFPQISSVKDRKRAVLLELGLAGFLTFLWFVGFCFLANQWQQTKSSDLTFNQGADAARAAISFSFFSIVSWAVITVRAFQRYRMGTDMSLFTTDQFTSGSATGPFPAYPASNGTDGTKTYQSPPFTENLDTSPKGYQIPSY